MSSYRREFDGTKYKFININEYKFKFRKNITKFGKQDHQVFDSGFAKNEKYLKTKRKSYKGKINIRFHNNEIPREGSQCIYQEF